MITIDIRTHSHTSHGSCRTVCGLDCGGLDIVYAHDNRIVSCESCRKPDTSRRDYLRSVTA